MDHPLLLLGGAVPDIGKVMSSTGPVVKCVLLRCTIGISISSDNDNDGDKKVAPSSSSSSPAAAAAVMTAATAVSTTTHPSSSDDGTQHHLLLHENLIEEILVDTTPRKSMVSKILGGPFTFLGQYEEEGICLLYTSPSPRDS